jgi:hypothetical protein
MIKIHIETLDGESEWEIKPNGSHYDLLILKSASEFHRDPGKAWHAPTEDAAAIHEIEALIEACFLAPSKTKWITILDGIRVTIRYTSAAGGAIKFTIRDFEDENQEVILMQRIFGLASRAIKDAELEEYIAGLADFRATEQ